MSFLAVPFGENWEQEYSPKIVKRQSDGKYFLRTRFTDAVGKPPLLVAGMTPTTTNVNLVAACTKAGYYCELAGGGYSSEQLWRGAVSQLVQRLAYAISLLDFHRIWANVQFRDDDKTVGDGVVANLLFLNQRLWAFQHSSLMKMREEEGVPVEGITIAAGVPSAERASELIREYIQAGLSYVGFKPGSIASIIDVVQIASLNPTMTILLQWTGGRGGGHHSFEDFHQPILGTYAAIRAQKNIVLVAGSGFGDAEGSWPYLTGDWSTKFGHSKMPFDAILLGSRIMVAKEAATSDQAKELLVATPGLEFASEKDWEKSYDGVVGGVATVRSELGEPIHKVATRGLLFWRDLDREVFSISPKDKQASKIEEKKSWIIQRLNSDFQKVYFGRKADGAVVDLADMTYAEVLQRMVDLMTTQPPADPARASNFVKTWIHPDYCRMTLEFISRVEERFSPVARPSILPDAALAASNPVSWSSLALSSFPETFSRLISAEDCDFFMQVCRRRGQKPPNFVPAIDRDLETWVKKDSLWYSENILALPEQDIQRSVILQGPVSVHYSSRANEPVAEILDSIHNGWLALAQKSSIAGQDVELLGAFPLRKNSLPSGSFDLIPIGPRADGKTSTKLRLRPALSSVASGSDPLPSPPSRGAFAASYLNEDNHTHQAQWQEMMRLGSSTFSNAGWWQALLQTPHIASALGRYVPNTLKDLFKYQSGAFVEFELDEARSLLSAALLAPGEAPLVTCRYEPSSKVVSVDVYNNQNFLHLQFSFRPEQIWAPIRAINSSSVAAIKSFYKALWFGPEDSLMDLKQNPEFAVFKKSVTATHSSLESYLRSVGRFSQPDKNAKLVAPIDYAIVAAWKPLVAPLFLESIPGDLLRLVHLNNSFKQVYKSNSLCVYEGDSLSSESQVTQITNTAAGLVVGVKATLQHAVSPRPPAAIEISSQFLFRRTSAPSSILFKREESARKFEFASNPSLRSVLHSKKWMKLLSSVSLEEIDVAYVSVEHIEKPGDLPDNLNVMSTGALWSDFDYDSGRPRGQKLGEISYHADGVAGGAVASFLQRFSKPIETPIFFEHDGIGAIVSV